MDTRMSQRSGLVPRDCDLVERPFALPGDSIEIVLDLPFPPSVNHIWRRTAKRVYRSAKYLRWMSNADMMVMSAKQYPRRKITGQFDAHILLDEQAGQGDCDNRIKVCLDWLVSRDIVTDDRFCRRLTVEWAAHERAPRGARVIVRSLHG